MTTRDDPSRADVRPAGPDDEPFLRRLHDADRSDLAGFGLPAPALATLLQGQWDALRRGWAATVPPAEVAVIEVDGVPCGWLVLAEGPAELVLVDLRIVPGMRGSGVGGGVLRAVVDRSVGRPVSLHVANDNPAKRLYERHGFVAVAADDVRTRMVRPAQGRDPT